MWKIEKYVEKRSYPFWASGGKNRRRKLKHRIKYVRMTRRVWVEA